MSRCAEVVRWPSGPAACSRSRGGTGRSRPSGATPPRSSRSSSRHRAARRSRDEAGGSPGNRGVRRLSLLRGVVARLADDFRLPTPPIRGSRHSVAVGHREVGHRVKNPAREPEAGATHPSHAPFRPASARPACVTLGPRRAQGRLFTYSVRCEQEDAWVAPVSL